MPSATNAPRASAAAVSPASTATGGELEKIRARGTLVVAIRLEAPPGNRAMGDPAHAQKRAFEMSVVTLVASAVFGPAVKVRFQGQGGDRLAALAQGADIAVVTETPSSRDRASISVPYAANAIVVAVKDGSTTARVEDLASRTVGVAQDEIVNRELAQAFFQERRVAVTLDTYQGVNGAAAALDADRAVAFIGDGIGVTLLAAERKLKVLTQVSQRPYVLATRQDAADLASAVSGALHDALTGGAVRDAAVKASFPYRAP